MAPLDFLEDDVTLVESKLSGAAGALGAQAIELSNWLIFFECVSEEYRVVVANLDDWMANSYPPRVAYSALMACQLVAMDKSPGVRPVGIGETLCRAIAKLIMRAVGDEAKMAYGSLQLCAVLEAEIEGAAHAVAQRRQERNAPAMRERTEEE